MDITTFKICRRIVNGCGSFYGNIAEEAASLNGHRTFLVCDPILAKLGLTEKTAALLREKGFEVAIHADVEPEPRVESVLAAAEQARAFGADCVIGIGGGSSLDTAKTCSVLLGNQQDIRELYGIEKVSKPGAPLILVPTSAGTGSEVTDIAILSDEAAQLKMGIVSRHMLPASVILDPELTLSLPKGPTAASGMDALIHAMEAYTSIHATPLTDMWAEHAIALIAPNLRVSSSLSGLTYELQVNEIPMSRGHLEQGMVLARESEDTLRMLGLDVRRGENFLPDVESLWIPAEKQALLEQAGLSCMTHSRILAYHLSLILARHASSFIGMQETKYLLDRMEERAPDLVREATRLLPVQRIAEIFQRLAQEQVSIRDLRNILEAIIEWSPKEKDTVMLTEYVRGALKRQISYMYSRGQNMLPAILMDPSVEETIRKAIRQTSAGAFLALDPDTSRRFIAAVGAAAGDYRKHVQMPVLLASMDIRRYVRRLIEGEHYRLPVVSYQELTPEISVQPMNRIRL